MNEKPNGRVCFEGRDCDVLRAYLYVTNYYDIWLQDVETQSFTNICTVTDCDLPVGDHLRLVHEAYVELLADAGYAIPTGEVIETEKYGRLHYCEVSELEPTMLLGGLRSGEEEPSINIKDREPDRGDGIEL